MVQLAEHAGRVLGQQLSGVSETPLAGVPEAVRAQADCLDLVCRGSQLLHEIADGGFKRGRGVEERGGIPGILGRRVRTDARCEARPESFKVVTLALWSDHEPGQVATTMAR